MHKTIAAKRRLLITEFRGFDMTKHLFLTGEKGIGKSSLIKVLLKRSPGPFGGFFTVKKRRCSVWPNHSSFVARGNAGLPMCG